MPDDLAPDEGSPEVFLPPPGVPPRLVPRPSTRAAIAAGGIAALALGAIVLSQAGLHRRRSTYRRSVGDECGKPGPRIRVASAVAVAVAAPDPHADPVANADTSAHSNPGLAVRRELPGRRHVSVRMGRRRIGPLSPGIRQWVVPGRLDGGYYLDAEPFGLVAEDTHVQANVTFVRGSGHAGVLCRRSDSRPAFYYFAIGDKNSEGYTEYLVGQHDDGIGTSGDGVSITLQDFGPSPVIGLLCLGTSPVTVIGFINGERIISSSIPTIRFLPVAPVSFSMRMKTRKCSSTTSSLRSRKRAAERSTLRFRRW